MKSTHKVEVVPVQLKPHPSADLLSIVDVFGYTCCVKTDDWKGHTLAAYIPPDSVVDATKPEFSFLLPQAKADGKARIKAKKLRGIVSFGCLVPAPAGTNLGDDVADLLGVTHYEPQENLGGGSSKFMGGESSSPPENIVAPTYDLDAFRRYHECFDKNKAVWITEKVDGASSRYVYQDGVMYCGSRNMWKKEFPSYDHVSLDSLIANGVPADKAQGILEKLHSQPKKKNIWWEILEKTPSLEKFCKDNPGIVVYGEVYGNVNSIKYGLPDGNRFAGFDMMKHGKWMEAFDVHDLVEKYNIPWVPMLEYANYFSFDRVCELAEGNTLVKDAKPGTIREGCVVKQVPETYNPLVGRLCLKCVSAAYLEKYR